MKFGLFYLPTYLPETRDAHTHYHNMVEQVVYADRIGIDYAWMVEHHFVRHGGLLPANYAFLSYLAGRTERIRLGTGGNDPAAERPPCGWRNRPPRSTSSPRDASTSASDAASFATSFDAFGVPMKESRERVEEGVALIRKAWSEPTLEFEGGFRPPMTGLPILPPVYQKPHPPIWVACLLSPESFEWTAREGHNLLYVAYHVDHDIAVERIGWYRDALTRSGRRIEDHEICCVYHAHFRAEDDDARLEAAVHTAMSEYATAGLEATRRPADPVAYKGYEQRDAGQRKFTFESYFPGRVLMGGPDQAIERIKVLADIGITQIGMLVDFGSLPQEEIMRSLEIFGKEVLPRVREL